MKLIIYYSLTGSCRSVANTLAAENELETLELCDVKRRRMINAYFLGARQAMLQLDVPIKPVEIDLTKYDTFVLVFPIWAGFPAPPFNNAVELLPEGAHAELVFVSSSGSSEKGRPFVLERLKSRGIVVDGYKDIRA